MASHCALVIDPGPNCSPASCHTDWALTTEAETSIKVGRGSLEEWQKALPEVPGNICVALPTQWASSMAIPMPATRERLLQRALPYAVEDYLIEPVEDYHIANLGIDDNGQVEVAAMKSYLLEEWCQWFDQRFPTTTTRFILTGWLYHKEADQVVIDFGERQQLVTYGKWLCTTAEEANRSLLKATASQIVREEQVSSNDIEPPRSSRAEISLDTESLLQRALDFSGPDLRQGKFKQPAAHSWRRSVAVAIASVVCSAAIYSAGQYYLANQLNLTSSQIRSESEALYRRTFSATGNLVNPSRQAQHHVTELKSSWRPEESTPTFLHLFEPASHGLAAWSNDNRLILYSLDYKQSGTSLSLQMATDSISSLNSLKKFLASRGLEARILNTTDNDQEILGRLEIGLTDDDSE